ncbi:MAG: type 4a pilus biogenesis protein PilO [Chromatiales bacterium]|jgi:type IV pilus assembly protein PilO
MTLSELNDLDFSNLGDWPMPIKVGAIILICGLMLGGWYYYHIQNQHTTLERYEKEEVGLKEEFAEKHSKVVNLEAYRKQLAEMEEAFGVMLRQLPDKSEIADLLVDVSQTGLGSGLEFTLFQPLGETQKDFYVELPISMKVVGLYHQFGEFISGLAALPRIITIHNVQIGGQNQRRGQQNTQGSGILQMSLTAKTYRYIGEGDKEGGS